MHTRKRSMILILLTYICSILDNIATKTLLAILRAHWPEGVFSFNEAPESFWPSVLSEFRVNALSLCSLCLESIINT